MKRKRQKKKLNIEYAKSQSLLDSMYDEDFQKKYDAYQKKIDKNNDDIQKQLELKQGNNDTLQNLKLKDTTTEPDQRQEHVSVDGRIIRTV